MISRAFINKAFRIMMVLALGLPLGGALLVLNLGVASASPGVSLKAMPETPVPNDGTATVGFFWEIWGWTGGAPDYYTFEIVDPDAVVVLSETSQGGADLPDIDPLGNVHVWNPENTADLAAGTPIEAWEPTDPAHWHIWPVPLGAKAGTWKAEVKVYTDDNVAMDYAATYFSIIDKAHLTAVITAPPDGQTYNTCQDFEVTAEISNIGEATAQDVWAELIISDNASVVAGADPQPLGDLVGGGLPATATWMVHCDSPGDSILTVDPTGIDANTGAEITEDNTDEAAITLHQVPNNAPVAIDDTARTNEETPVAIDVVANDSDVDGDYLSVATVTQGGNGSVSINDDDTVTYTPNDNFYGTDLFTYIAYDGTDYSNEATVTIAVNMAGRMSGVVRETDGQTPIGGVTVAAYDATSGNLGGTATSASDGTYTITVLLDLSPGFYKVKAGYPGSYADEWYEEEATPDMAKPVKVNHGEDTLNIDFTLSQLHQATYENPVVIDEPSGMTIVFNDLSQGDVIKVSINVSKKNPGGDSSEFRFLGTWYDIVTDPDYTGSVTLTISYDDAGLKKEDKLGIRHWTGTDWEDVTIVDRDMDNNTITGQVSSLSWFAIVEPNNPPEADAGGPYCVQLGTSITLIGTGSDPDGDPIEFAWDLDNDGIFETAGQSTTFEAVGAGLHIVALAVTDDLGAQAIDSTLVVVYDPAAGFATGGGRIIPGSTPDSADDHLPQIDSTSPASFGFVVKYKRGADTPSGQLEFQYRQGNFNLHSSGMEWLVIVNSNWAKFQGAATIKGLEGLFPFRVDARDGDHCGGDEPDRFIIKVYAPGADPDKADPVYKASGDLIGGSVIIHAK